MVSGGGVSKSPSIVEALGATAYLAFLRWPDGDIGNKECVHVAQVHHPKHGGKASFIKLYPPGQAGKRGLANEVSGYLVASACDLPQPGSASIVPVPLDKLPDGRPAWVGECVAMLKAQGSEHFLYPGFCTGPLEGQSAFFSLQGRDPDLLRQDLLKWRDLPRVLAFDDGIANVDRHLNNLVRLSRQKYAVIDHGRLVQSLGNWDVSQLDAMALFRHRLLEILYLGNSADDATVSATLDEAVKLGAVMGKVSGEVGYWLRKILGDADGSAFLEFLTQRLGNIELVLRKRHRRVV
jgi:hypothetical protein